MASEGGLRAVEYTVSVDELTGGASVRVSVPATAARALTPRLALVGGGGGNSVVGLGWTLESVAAVTIDTSEHLPRWDGRDGVALGGVPLVAWLDDAGQARGRVDGEWAVTFLRPQRGFARVRVERWRHRATGDVHFRSRDEADVVTIYGARPGAAGRIADGDDPSRVASWLPELQVDPDGNAVWFDYAAEDGRGIDRTAPWEPRRLVTTARYLVRLSYGNVTPLALTPSVIAGERPIGRWAFALVVDHGDHGSDVPTFDPDRVWPVRSDPFAAGRAGFPIRTYRRVRRIVCFHDRVALGPDPVAVTALALGYDDAPGGARLTSVQQLGYRADATRATPPMTFTYAPAGIDRALVPTTSGLGPRRTLVDLYGEGMPGVLYQGERGWLYEANRGGGRFAAPALVDAQPNLTRGAVLGDLDRDGDTELAILSGRQAGTFALGRDDGRWRGFRPFAALPRVEAAVGRTFWIDLNGDGRADVVVAHGESLTWFPSRSGPLDEATHEFESPIEVRRSTHADAAPLCGPDARLNLMFADMTGDGLADLVRVGRSTIEYWPSLGNGRFGERVVMDAAPRLANVGGYDSGRVRLVDVSGSGCADLLHLDDGCVWHYPNLGGRGFGAARRVTGLPRIDGRHVAVADLSGDGRASLVWTTPGPGRAHALSYLPLTPATPPGSLVAVDDGLGRRTELTWGSSATHYLRDAAEGAPWSTRMPSHRPVVDARVERDRIGGTRTTTRYRYRDGYYDGALGAARGFGRVDAYDRETVDGEDGGPDALAFAAPLCTRTWFHRGTAMHNHERPFEPYVGAPRLPLHVEPGGALRSADASAALRALAGSMIRRERWAVDADGVTASHPIDVEAVCHQIVMVQPRRGRDRPVFASVPIERAVATYEQVADDPRIAHEVVVAFDRFGAPTRTATIAYARRGAVEDPAQARTWITVTDSARVDLDTDDRFVVSVAAEIQTFELCGVGADRITPAQLRTAEVAAALNNPQPHEAALDPDARAPIARRVGWERTYYWDDARETALPHGSLARSVRIHHAEAACATPERIAATLGARVDDARLASLGYHLADGHWWQASPTQRFGGRFGIAVGTARSDGAITTARHDDDELAVIETIDALGLSTQITLDDRAMAPARTIDPNGAITEVAYDPLGIAVATAQAGAIDGAPWGCASIAGWTPPPVASLAALLADPAAYLGPAATTIWIDDGAWLRDRTPTTIATLARTQFDRDGGGPIEIAVRYLDGFGRALQEKTRVEPGLAIARAADGEIIVDEQGPVLAWTDERWRVSGHVVYDAKGQPGRVFEPYFSSAAGYESDAVLQRFGVSTLTRYDAAGRVMRVDLPNGTFATTAYAAWASEQASPGDNVLDSTYRLLRAGRPADDPERAAYEHAVTHAGTTTRAIVDARGQVCATLARGDVTTDERRTRTIVDASSHIVAQIDPRGLTAFTYTRDLRGRPLFAASVDAGTTWSLPDAFDRAALAWDARGVAIERRFDHADRPTQVHVRGGDALLDHTVETITYGDEDPDRLAARAANTLGRAVRIRDAAGEVRTLRYLPSGAPLATARRLRVALDDTPDWRSAVALDDESLSQAQRYDAIGRVVAETFVDGTSRTLAYHPGGALARVGVTTPDGALVDTPIVADAHRDAHGRPAALALGNGTTVTWGYDRETGRLTAQDAARDGRRLQGLRFTFDPDGRIVRAWDLAHDGPAALIAAAVSARRDFAYDAHGRLVRATGRIHQALLPHDYIPGTAGTISGTRHLSLDNGAALERFTQQFTYDPSGNLTRLQHSGATHSWATDFWIAPDSNRSLAALGPDGVPISDPAAHFDAAGHTVRLAHLRSLAWSWRGCLSRAITIARADGPVDDGEAYSYGADRLRVRKLATRLLVGGDAPVIETREVVYLGDQQRLRVRRGATLVLECWTTHVSDGDRRVATIDRHVVDTLGHEVDAIGPARVRYHLTTPQGSTALELDEAGLLLSYEEYLPHGGTAFLAGDDAREVARRDVRYAGQERDRATGLHAYPLRYFAPWLGRWLSPDPIGPEDDLNLYQFVGGDPIGKVDPRGTDSKWWSPLLQDHPELRCEPLEPSRAAAPVVPQSTPGGSVETPFSDEYIEFAAVGPVPVPSPKELAIRGELDQAFGALAKVRDRYSDPSWGSAPEQAFKVYRDVLSEIETSARTGDRIDVKGLWDRAQHFSWDWKHTRWMQDHAPGNRGFSEAGVFSGSRVAGVDVDALFRVATSKQNPDPTRFERAAAFTLGTLESIFVVAVSGGIEAFGIGTVARTVVRAEFGAAALEATVGLEGRAALSTLETRASTALTAEARSAGTAASPTVARAGATATKAETGAATVEAAAARTEAAIANAPTSIPGGAAGPGTTPSPTFKTQRLRDQFIGENLRPGTWHGEPTTVRYLDAAERQPYRITVQDGKLYDANGKLFDTMGSTTLHRSSDGRAIFVMDAEGGLYASLNHARGEFHHSSFLAGGPVGGAGELLVENGVLKVISRRSGHYRPSAELLDQTIVHLKRLGVRTERVLKESF